MKSTAVWVFMSVIYRLIKKDLWWKTRWIKGM